MAYALKKQDRQARKKIKRGGSKIGGFVLPKPVKKDWKGKKIVWWKLRGKRMKRGEKRTVCNKGQRNVSENGRCDIIKKVQRGGWFGRNSNLLPA